MKHFSKSEIRQASKAKVIEFEIPEWGVSVFLKKLPASAVVELAEKYQGIEEYKNGKLNMDLIDMFALMISKSVVDVSGEYVFSADEVKDFEITVLQELIEGISKLNNLDTNMEQAKEELEKNPFVDSVSD